MAPVILGFTVQPWTLGFGVSGFGIGVHFTHLYQVGARPTTTTVFGGTTGKKLLS